MDKLIRSSAFLGVGLEGVFGIIGITVFVLVFGAREETARDVQDIVYFVSNYRRLRLLIAAYCSVTIINMGSGYLVTRTAGAATRATFNSLRPYLVFIIGLALGLESFAVQRQIGYLISVVAVMAFNNVIVVVSTKKESKTTKSPA